MDLLEGSFVRSIDEFTVDEKTSLERRLSLERSVVEFVGECGRHSGVMMGTRSPSAFYMMLVFVNRRSPDVNWSPVWQIN
jgi:hypothetical protein